ncbi:MAG: hypothetical protein U0Q12_17840 [Vicinamibacterales bacterium]
MRARALAIRVFVAGGLAGGLATYGPSQAVRAQAGTGVTMEVVSETRHDVSPALGSLPTVPGVQMEEDAPMPMAVPTPAQLKGIPEAGSAPDTALQTVATAPNSFASQINNFDGIPVNGGSAGFVAPPDTNGAVGTTQYVQVVNTAVAVYNKTNGALQAGPTVIKALWAGFGGDCETRNDGDPVVLFDRISNRWLITQFAIGPFVTGSGNFLQCFAVSTTSDATGTYNRYAFNFGNDDFIDYGKLGVWPDAYYMNFNTFNKNGSAFKYGKQCGFNRAQMVAGQPAQGICFNTPNDAGFLPADLEGKTLPPAGAANPFIEIWDIGANGAMAIWPMHLDFATPANSTFGPARIVPVAPFGFAPGARVPQLGTTTRLDTLGDRMMFRAAYRNFGAWESLVVNHSVGSSAQISPRWYEFRAPRSANPQLFQQGTYAPDATFRWMGSIGMDKRGNMAMGYSASSSSLNPGIRLTGRLRSEPRGFMQQEMVLLQGSGSQTVRTSGAALTRWGDYSSITVDPVDDCTLWYTTEYIPANGVFNWNTRIISFKFPNCQ